MKGCLSPLMLAAATAAMPAHAALTDAEIREAAEAVQPQVVEWRRWFHQNPELSNREVNTAARLAEILEDMGLEPRTGIAGHGLTAFIEGDRPGPLVAIRADMDGLPVTEQTGLPFASTATGEYLGEEVGVMHACGHDAHMAMALGAAKVLNDHRDQLAGTVQLIFQPAEEGPPPGEPGGASLMIEEGLFDAATPAAVFGMHVDLGTEPGKIATRTGPFMAASDRFEITVRGRQTHGARPWGGVDPIVTAAQIINALQTIPSREVDVTKAPSIVSVGRIGGGVRYNVIPDEVEMQGTIRSFDPAMREHIHAAIERVATATAEASRATAEVLIDPGPPPVINDAGLTQQMWPTLERVMGTEGVDDTVPHTVAEDFSEYAAVAPTLFFFLGTADSSIPPQERPSNHSPEFTVHEPMMQKGVEAFVALVNDFLAQAAD